MTPPVNTTPGGAWTPGPWQCLHKKGVSVVYSKTKLADVFSEAFGDRENQEANARLIASAPSLYAALAGMVAIYDGIDPDMLPDAERAALSAARLALNVEGGK